MKEFEKRAQAWLDGDFDADSKAAVRELQKDPAALEDAFHRNLEFGTGGLRGLMGVGTNRINKYTVGMATQGLANYMKANVKGPLSVCVSFDSRNNSPYFAQITADVLSANGIKVWLFTETHPVPLVSFAVRHKKATAGVMITASHNPKEYNGYKVFWSDGAQIISPVDKDIVAEVAGITDPSQVKFTGNPDLIETMGRELDEAYFQSVLPMMLSPQERKKHAGLKIVYTPLHGSGVRLVPEALRRLGFVNVLTVKEQEKLDGNFPTVASPNPEEPAALKMALELADKEAADLVMGTDPDADRMGIAVRDNNGEMLLLNGNQTAAMLTYYILTRRKELGTLSPHNYVVKTIVTTPLVADIAASFGVECFDVLTGFKYIAEIVRRYEGKREFVCGGEESFGFNVGEHVRDKDAVISCCMVAECAAWAAEQGMSLYTLMQKIYEIYGYRKEGLVSLVRKGVAGAQEIQQIMSDFREEPPKQLAGSPVVRVIDYNCPDKTGLPKSNVLQFFSAEGDVVTVRPSGTEPKIKFYFGAKGVDSDAKIESLKKQFA
jgi:phosphoglucomutase